MKKLIIFFLLALTYSVSAQVTIKSLPFARVQTRQAIIDAVRDSFFTTTGSDTVAITASPAGELYFELRDVGDTTTVTPTVATLTSTAASSIGATTANSGGNITSIGNAVITAKGVVWNTSTTPTIALSTKTSDGTQSVAGTFTSAITGLTAETLYYLRAWATNSIGTAYGNQVTFTTSAASACPNTADLSTYANGTPATYDNINSCYTVTDGSGDYGNSWTRYFRANNVEATGMDIVFTSFSLNGADKFRVQYYSQFNAYGGNFNNAGTYAYTWTAAAPPTIGTVYHLERFGAFELITDGATVDAGFVATLTPLGP